jgi:hypothetical protein
LVETSIYIPNAEANPREMLRTKDLERLTAGGVRSKQAVENSFSEGYGLQPVHKWVKAGSALAAEGTIFPRESGIFPQPLKT